MNRNRMVCLSVCAFLVCGGAAFSEIRIIPVGDSNTMGIGNPAGTGDNSKVIGYRKKLKELLAASGVTTDFVGQRSSGSYYFTDTQHEGYPGEGIDRIHGRVVSGMITTYSPDILLLLIGSNDMWISLSNRSAISDEKAQYWVGRLADLVDDMIAARPTMHIIIAKPATPGNAQRPLAIYRTGIEQIVTDRKSQGRKISSVDFMGASNDGTHYTVSGHEECARRWHAEIMKVLGGMPSPPARPTGLTATAKNSSTIDLAWRDASTNETGFKIERKQDGLTEWVGVAQLGAGVTRYSNTGLPARTKFYYRVKAFNAGGDSAPSDEATATTLPSNLPPVPFTAYNDLSWKTGQLAGNITRYTTATGGATLPDGSGGFLKDYASGTPVPVTVSVSGGTWSADTHAGQGAEPASGTDAYNVFNGKVNCLGVIGYGDPVVLNFTGLESGMKYEIVLFENRNDYDGQRSSTFTISDVDSFVNQSSAGTGASAANASVTISAMNTTHGYVARYTGIDGGSDGDMRITMTGTLPYINAFMLRATAAGGSSADSDGDGMSDADETLAGTNPNDRNDVMAISESTPVSWTQFTLKWRSVAGRTYRIMRGIDLTTGLNELVKGNIVASPPVNSEAIAMARGCCYYRISLQ